MNAHSKPEQSNQAQTCFMFGNDRSTDDDGCFAGWNFQNHHYSPPQSKQAAYNTNKEKEAMDRYLSETMKRLSVEDRQKAQEEVYGIGQSTNEQVDIDKCLDSLENHIYLIKRGSAYETAEKMNSAYVQSQALRQLFLKRNQYDPRAAADGMIQFFEMKQELFGKEKLTQEILLGDLDQLSQECVASGDCQILAKPDRANRPLFFCVPGLRKRCPIVHEMRSQFYIIMTLLRESEEIQKNGVVGILYTVGKYRDFEMGSGARQLAKLASALPIPMSGMHFCCDDLAQHVLVNGFIPLLPKNMALKFKAHYGTDMECLYAMRSFGISEDSIPITTGNDNHMLDDHKRWYQDRREKDAQIAIEREALRAFESGPPSGRASDETESMNEILTPKPQDVLFGNHTQHPGNVRLHKLLEEHADAYEQTKGKKVKMEYALKLVLHMKDEGSRFLTFDKASKSWMEVSDTKARLKISKTIRNRRR